MTLDTRIYIHDATDRSEVFARCQGLLGVPPHDQFSKDENGTMANRPGQGLPAWLMLHYGASGPLRPAIEHCDCGSDYACEPRCSKDPAYLEIMFDTAYGYSDDRGRGCGDLHACYIAQLGQWLDERGVAWSWRNEFTGEIHGGEDRYTRLPDLMNGGTEATEWFRSVVQPVIEELGGDVPSP